MNKRIDKLDQYTHILFDADGTLFDFDAYNGLCIVFKRHNQTFTKKLFEEYKNINRPLWDQYQLHEITATQVQCKRFEHWQDLLGKSAQDINTSFLDAMSEICAPIDGAKELLDALHGKVEMGIITNGFTQLQKTRLKRTNFTKYFATLVVSEEVGVAKPHPEIFNHTLTQLGNPHPARVLMVGDTLASDIAGGTAAGLHTCWLNPNSSAITGSQQLLKTYSYLLILAHYEQAYKYRKGCRITRRCTEHA
jgi:YjjG family noncanonical pyrimidine nucleotidase